MATRIASLALVCALLAPLVGSAASYDEASSGDLSGDRLAPTSLSLDAGSNSLAGTTTQGDLDYVTIFAPAPITAIVLSEYVSINDTSFIAIQSGAVFSEPNVGADPANLLGWAHFGPGAGAGVGVDILPILGAASPAIGFTAPLPAGTYTLWIQQTSNAPTDYTFAFTVPEPGELALVALGVAALLAVRRR